MIKLCRDNYLIWPMEAVVGPNSYPINPTASHISREFMKAVLTKGPVMRWEVLNGLV